jgi:hypothetical protein
MKLASSAPEFTATVNSHIIMTIVNNWNPKRMACKLCQTVGSWTRIRRSNSKLIYLSALWISLCSVPGSRQNEACYGTLVGLRSTVRYVYEQLFLTARADNPQMTFMVIDDQARARR